MKNKNIYKIALLLALILTTQALLIGCKATDNRNTTNQATTQSSEINTDILSQANNEALIDNSLECTYSDFKAFNIPKDVYDRIATSIYISEVKDSIGLPMLRKSGEVYYSVHPIKTDSNNKLYGFIMYNNQGKLIDGWCTDTLHSKNVFSKLTLGSKFDNVTKIDPYCCFMENLKENKANSYHKLKGGKVYVIDYQRTNKNNDYVIKDMHYNNDPCNFTTIILQQDLALIL